MAETKSYIEKRGETVGKLIDSIRDEQYRIMLDTIQKLKKIDTSDWGETFVEASKNRKIDDYNEVHSIIRNAAREFNNLEEFSEPLFEIIWFGNDNGFIEKAIDYGKSGCYHIR